MKYRILKKNILNNNGEDISLYYLQKKTFGLFYLNYNKPTLLSILTYSLFSLLFGEIMFVLFNLILEIPFIYLFIFYLFINIFTLPIWSSLYPIEFETEEEVKNFYNILIKKNNFKNSTNIIKL